MHYMRGAFVLAFGQVTLMHCVRAVLALAVAIALPQMACAQTPNAIHMIISPVRRHDAGHPHSNLHRSVLSKISAEISQQPDLYARHIGVQYSHLQGKHPWDVGRFPKQDEQQRADLDRFCIRTTAILRLFRDMDIRRNVFQLDRTQ